MMATGKRVVSSVLIRVLLCLLTFLGSLIGVYAQGPDEEGVSSLDVPSGQLSLTFEQLGYDIKELPQFSSRPPWQFPGFADG
jgi:hypothetical protein